MAFCQTSFCMFMFINSNYYFINSNGNAVQQGCLMLLVSTLSGFWHRVYFVSVSTVWKKPNWTSSRDNSVTCIIIFSVNCTFYFSLHARFNYQEILMGVLKQTNESNILSHLGKPIPYHCRFFNVLIKSFWCVAMCLSLRVISYAIQVTDFLLLYLQQWI